MMNNDQLSSAIAQLMSDAPSAESAAVVCEATAESVVQQCQQLDLEADYVIERSLERLLAAPDQAAACRERVQSYWLLLPHLDGVEVFELKVRAAELIASVCLQRGAQAEATAELAGSELWTDRLIAGWIVRDLSLPWAEGLRQDLATDDFTDDNGIHLVREAVGVYED